MAIVGTAYIATKVISNNLSKDLKKSVEQSTKDLTPEFKKMGTELGDVMGDSMGKEVRKSVQKSTRDIDRDGTLRNTFSRLGSAMSGWMSKAFTKDSERDWKGAFKAMGSTIKPLFFLALVPALAVGLQAINAWVGQASALIGVISSALVGSTVALAGSLTAIGLAGIAVLLAFKAETPTLERFKEVAAAVGQEFKQIGVAVQKELLPRLGEAMVILTDTIPVLKEGMAGIGEEVGKTAVKFAKMVTEAENLERLNIILGYSKKATADFGDAFVSLTESALILLAAAKPLTLEFSNWVKELTAGWTASLKLAEANGSLAGFLDRASERAKSLGRIIRDLTAGIVNFFTIGSETGDGMLKRIEDMSLRFREWTESVEGENAIRDWFVQADRVGREFNGLIGDIFRAFGELFKENPDAAVEFIQAIRQSVPALVGAVPGIVALVGAFAEMIAVMAETGALGIITTGLSLFLQLLTAIMQVPIVGALVAFVAALTPVWVLLGKLGWLMPLLNGLWSILSTAVLAVAAAFGVSVGWAIAIIAAFVALVAGIVWLIKNWDLVKEKTLEVWETIKNWIGDRIDDIKEFFDNLGDKLSGVVEWFGDAWDSIKETTARFVNAILDFFSPLVNFFSSVLPAMFGVFKAYWTTLFTIMMLPVKIFVGAVLLAWDWITDKFSEAWSWISSWVSEKWNQLVDMLSEPLNAAKENVKAAWDATKGWFSDAWAFVTGWVSSKWNSLKDALSGPIETAKERIRSAFQAIKDKASEIWGKLGDGLSSAVSKIKGSINGIIGNLNSVVRAMNTVINGVNKLPGPDLPTIPYIPRLAKGGVVSPTSGGTMAIIAEAGSKERVEPLDSQGLSKRDRALISTLSGGGPSVRVFIGDRELTDIIRVEQDRGNYSLARSLAAGRRA